MEIVGREREQDQLSAFIRLAGGQALVLRGDTGVGKTALLDFATGLAAAEGHQIVRATGVEAESGLPYAGLHQLLYPLLQDAGGSALDPATRAVFDAVFGQAQGRAPSMMALGIAVLNLLARAGAEQPVLLVVDDGQWLDEATADVCGFVGRRLTGSAVKLLVAVRADLPSRFDTAALPETPVTALPADDAARLLDRRHPDLGRQVRQVVLEQARGNPLTLIELPAQLADEPAAEDLLVRHGVPIPRRLHHVYGSRITALRDTVRAELLLGALDGVGTRTGVSPAPGRRHRMTDVDDAVACGLLDIEPGTGDYTFRHPLVRSSVVQLATPNQRRAAHERLALFHRDDLERRATHLAAATIDPDDEVAAVLEAAAQSVTRRGGALAAVTWLTRAAELTEDRADRSRRLAHAAFVAAYAARLGQAHRLVRADRAPGAGESVASASADAYAALYREGDVRSTERQVVAAIKELRDSGRAQPEDMSRLVAQLLAIGMFAGDQPAWERIYELIDSLDDCLIDEQTRIYANTCSDVVRHGAGWAEPVERAATMLAELEPWDVTRLAAAAYFLDILGRFRPHLQRTVDRELATGAVVSGVVMLRLIMLDQVGCGEWEEAERTGQRALDQAVEHGLELYAYQARVWLAHLAALRGQLIRARDLQGVVDAWARPRGLGMLTQTADAVGALAALSAGDYEAAYLYAIGITEPGQFRPYAVQAPRTLLELVEAALHTGRAEQARRHALAARDAGLPALSPRLAVLTYGALAMTAESDREAAEMVALAESHPEAARFPFELARIRLAHGVRIRHVQGRTAARRFLAPAAETFERLGAGGWTERAQAELRATGAAPRLSALSLASLTWQERRIAELAAGGLTNKEIGKRTNLSPRTVSSHLYRIFPKLGITTRAALRDALSRSGELSEA
ncbi:DNA-binding CsgD family transcriptional regulator [Catenulispora sp. GP43]|uniref:helix-turn-helix transcriptional regulator n=1 Tax=Catenulispora sp. GP43 TaxID=3156263 RepID=UPI003511E88C